MKKRPASNILTLLAGLCLLAGTAGCFSVDSAVGGVSGEEYVVVRNYGWKAFKFIPLVSGNATENAWFPWAVCVTISRWIRSKSGLWIMPANAAKQL
jgi:hypothetical protein